MDREDSWTCNHEQAGATCPLETRNLLPVLLGDQERVGLTLKSDHHWRLDSKSLTCEPPPETQL